MKLPVILFILLSTQAQAAIERDLSTFYQGALGSSAIHIQSNEIIGPAFVDYETESDFNGILWLYTVEVGPLGYQGVEVLASSSTGEIEGVFNINSTAFNVILSPPHFDQSMIFNQDNQNLITAYLSIEGASSIYTFTKHEFDLNANQQPAITPPQPQPEVIPEVIESRDFVITNDSGDTPASGAGFLLLALMGIRTIFKAFS